MAGPLSLRCLGSEEEKAWGVDGEWDEGEASWLRSLCSCARYACTSALAGVSDGGLGGGARGCVEESVKAAADTLLLIVVFVLELPTARLGELLGEVTRDEGFRRRSLRCFSSGFPEVLLSFSGVETGDLSISWGLRRPLVVGTLLLSLSLPQYAFPVIEIVCSLVIAAARRFSSLTFRSALSSLLLKLPFPFPLPVTVAALFITPTLLPSLSLPLYGTGAAGLANNLFIIARDVGESGEDVVHVGR